MDVSILIVHYNTPGLLRQTLRGIRRAAPRVSHEVIVVDNNPSVPVAEMLSVEFPEAHVIVTGRNTGFGGGMNRAMEIARGRYFLVFNPDIALFPGAIEELVAYADAHPDVGMVAPRLRHPDGSVQASCFRFMRPMTVAYRRLAPLGRLPPGKREIDRHLMRDFAHDETRDVDYVLGASMLTRREAVEEIGRFDPAYFVYFEDQDWCRRFWKGGWRVVYHPKAEMVHYHRRETARGGLVRQLMNPLTRIQMQSARHYFRKYQKEENPRLALAGGEASS